MKNDVIRNTFLLSLKLDPAKLIFANQTHGNNVKIVDCSHKNTFIDNCDGLITTDKCAMLGVFTADCVPLLMFCENNGLKVAIHAGWRGLSVGIIENALSILKNHFCIRLEEIKVYIGPHIRLCCYEVGMEIENVVDIKLNGNKLDLARIVHNKLVRLGISEIFDVKRCTFHEEDLFFSYRRSQCFERMLSVIC